METVRQIGKYVTIATAIMGVASGIMVLVQGGVGSGRVPLAPIEISIACCLGLIVWVIGYVGVQVQKRLASRSLKNPRSR